MPETSEAVQPSQRVEEIIRVDEETRFDTGRVLSISAGHSVHDTYTAFLAPLLPALIQKFALSKAEAGLLSVFLQGPSVLQPLLGHLADRISLRYLVILAPGITGTMMSLLGAAPAYYVLPFLLIVAGLSSAGMHAVGPVMAGRLSGKNLGRGMSFWMVGGELGRTVGPLILVSAIGVLTLGGMPWLMIGGWTASVYVFIRLRGVSGRPPPSALELPWRAALSQMKPLMLPLAAILVSRSFVSASLTTYLPVFLSEEGADLFLAGASLSLLEGAGVVGALLGGSLSDRLGRRSILATSMVITPLLMFLFLAVGGWWRTALLPFLGLFSLSTTPVIMAMVQESYPDNRALANGVYMALGFTIRALVVVLLGGLADVYGMRQGFFISAILMLLGTPLVARLPSRPK
ncbi:MAG: MFS transporter [Anaerolineales bacterium]|nr:MFS transporter [Anaerolineales bacterium]